MSFELTKSEKKESIKKHLLGIASSGYHVKNGDNSVDAFMKLYERPNGEVSPGYDDKKLIEECIDDLVTEGKLEKK